MLSNILEKFVVIRNIALLGIKYKKQARLTWLTFKIITIAVSSGLFIVVLLLLHKTSLGKQIRAVSNNPELCNIYGINSDQVILYATALSAALAAIAGILIALDVDMTPTFGFN